MFESDDVINFETPNELEPLVVSALQELLEGKAKISFSDPRLKRAYYMAGTLVFDTVDGGCLLLNLKTRDLSDEIRYLLARAYLKNKTESHTLWDTAQEIKSRFERENPNHNFVLHVETKTESE